MKEWRSPLVADHNNNTSRYWNKLVKQVSRLFLSVYCVLRSLLFRVIAPLLSCQYCILRTCCVCLQRRVRPQLDHTLYNRRICMPAIMCTCMRCCSSKFQPLGSWITFLFGWSVCKIVVKLLLNIT